MFLKIKVVGGIIMEKVVGNNVLLEKAADRTDSCNAYVYTSREIQKMLHLSKTTTYRLLKKCAESGEPFKVLHFGGTYRIPKNNFDSWLNH